MHTMSLPLSFNVQAKFKFYCDEESMVKDWKQAAKYNASQATFLEGMLLKNVDPGGTLLYVDYSVFYGGMRDLRQISWEPLQKHSINNILRIQNHQYSAEIQPRRLMEEGCYDEEECIVRETVKQLPRTPVSKDSVYILSAFHTMDITENLERRWMSWSGAKVILWKCPKDLKLRRITFLRSTTERDSYSYLVLAECEEGMNCLNLARQFADHLKDRRCGLVGLYKVERYYIPQLARSHSSSTV